MMIGAESGSIMASTTKDSQGRFLLPNIQVGMPFDVHCDLRTGDEVGSQMACLLKSSGEQLELEFRNTKKLVTVRGRVIDAAGAPMANTQVAFGYLGGYDGEVTDHLSAGPR